MTTASGGSSGVSMNVIISNLLKYGVVLSAVLVILGLAIVVAKTPPSFPVTVGGLISSNYGKPTLDAQVLFAGVAAGNPLYLIQLGLLVLLATPIVRVALSVVLFAAERDSKYVVITLVVLGILAASILVVGPWVASTAQA